MQKETNTHLKVEVQMYLGSAVAPINQNPMEMWNDMKKVFPELYKQVS